MARAAPATDEMARIPAGTFRMGSDDHYPEEAPAHRVSVGGFSIDRHQITNRRFALFAAATGYVTVAERPLDPADFPGAPPENLVPGSLVFHRTAGPVDLRHLNQWWAWTPGASWKHPEGPGSSAAERADHPVVHVAYEDALAYARELAARGGLDAATYVWGDRPEPADRRLANYWRGHFPWRPEPGYGTTRPVGSYPPNGHGLFDMAGNVWEWTGGWYSARYPEDAAKPCCVPHDPRGGGERESVDPAQPQFAVPRKVIKGGSFLCADSYCLRYRPAARRGADGRHRHEPHRLPLRAPGTGRVRRRGHTAVGRRLRRPGGDVAALLERRGRRGGWGDGQLQIYTAEPANAALDGHGRLAITARREPDGAITSARLISKDRVALRYGRVEARIRVPAGRGVWAAFWLLGADINAVGWPRCGEIDVMEFLGSEPRTVHARCTAPATPGWGSERRTTPERSRRCPSRC